ncbi:hybrid sensor histidine kinase/response regulator transcription factor [Flavihumibacter petaseus]|uniref:histidine kinase n=1 Tax=Flavihumibacter petaseus NBRC 106054 TaxID=1220578 RepID=A0A0E9MVZ6_9BACT|nr:two-component regulator propeller domain-containing protein [Flavihumibacter petaseus]GAO41892.1 putative two-component hybrid sensor and regulator [Flavihumibacter petaseus NBRC 106054]
MRIIVILITACLAWITAAAQTLPVRYIGIDKGLSNNAVVCIYQDHDGFFWFGTYDGLNRYDGYNFTIFRNKIGDSSSLINNNVYTIEGDRHHNLWVGGQKGACVYDPLLGKFRPLKFFSTGNPKPYLLQDGVFSIRSLNNGNILAGTQRNGLILFKDPDQPGVQLPGPAAENGQYEISAIEEDTLHRKVWVFVRQFGLCQYDIAAGKLLLINNQHRQASHLAVDHEGNVWIATNEGVFRYRVADNTMEGNFLPANYKIVQLMFDRQNILWIASDGGGLWQLQPGSPEARPLRSANGEPYTNSNAIYDIYEDREGRKWVGTLRGGINILEPYDRPFTLLSEPVRHQSDIIKNFILAFCEDRAGNLWIGTDGAGLRYWNRQSNQTESFTAAPGNTSTLSSNFITGVMEDQVGNVWVSTWQGGINRFNWKTRRFEQFVCFNPYTQAAENNTWIVYEDRQHRIWASATNDGSLYLFSVEHNRFEIFDPAIQNIQSLFEDASGNFWGGNYTSLFRIDRENKQHQVFPLETTIRCIYEDHNGQLWLGTQPDGLLQFDRKTGKYRQFTTADGLPSNTILRILEDGKGYLWLSSFNGLSRFDPRTNTFRNFIQPDGLQSNQFSFNAAVALKNGDLAFGGIGGFNLFNPDSIITRKEAHPVYLSNIIINNRPVQEQQHLITAHELDKITRIEVPFSQASLSLDFLALDFSGGDKITYAYQLEGWDKTWSYTNNARSARYSRLQEGNYNFRVRIRDAEGKWTNETSLLQIVVLPPWYRSWWAYLLYIAASLSAIYLYLLYARRQERLRFEVRLAHLETENEKVLNERKLDFFTNISHEFRAPLSLIINPLKKLLDAEGSGKNRDDLHIVYRNARRLISLVDQLLLFRKADSGTGKLQCSPVDIVALCQDVYHCFIQQARTAGIAYTFNNLSGHDKHVLLLDREKMEIVLFNLLSNAFKFTPDEGKISLELREDDGFLGITISDSGCGIADAELATIFEKFRQAGKQKKDRKPGFGIGLYLVKTFVEAHQGVIRCFSRKGEGTSFELLIPLQEPATEEAPVGDELAGSGLLEELAAPGIEAGIAALSSQGKGRVAEESITEKKTLLLVDDNRELLQYLQELFSTRFVVYTAESGEAGLISALQTIPDLVISDVNMTGMNGVELCSAIKKSPQLAHIPVILLTGETAKETQLLGIEGGADDYILKPFDANLLVAKTETIIKNRSLLQRYFFDSITLHESAVKVPAEYQEFLRRCIQVVEENIDVEEFTIARFAKAMGMSRSRLYEKVKAISGQSLNAFVRSIRLRRAAVLLLTEDLNINQAAYQVGIEDVRYFREQFVKLFGMNPSEYIRRYRHSFNREYNIIKK